MTDRRVAFGGGAMNVIGMCADVDPPVLERQGIARAEARTVDDDAAIESGKGDQELLEIGIMGLQIRKNLLAAIRRPVRDEAILRAQYDAFIARSAAARIVIEFRISHQEMVSNAVDIGQPIERSRSELCQRAIDDGEHASLAVDLPLKRYLHPGPHVGHRRYAGRNKQSVAQSRRTAAESPH